MYFYHYYNNDDDFQNDYWGTPYHEPWVSKTILEGDPDHRVNYNKKMKDGYLTFDVKSQGKIVWRCTDSSYAKTIEYKKNDEDWTSITSTTEWANIYVNAGDKVMFRGDNATYGTPDYPFSGGSTFNGTNVTFDVYGNAMSLIDSENFSTMLEFPDGSKSNFAYLFSGCSMLLDASQLVLPAMVLNPHCYAYMFYGCDHMTVAPTLPSKILADNCYYFMFSHCYQLREAPELKAVTLAPFCYEEMFSYCTSLTKCPDLIGRNTPRFCCKCMFKNCTSLVKAPSIINGPVAEQCCFHGMFENCTSLTKGPDLPAKEVHGWAYYYMFGNCTSLITAPEIAAERLTRGEEEHPEPSITSVGNMQCFRMFSGCTSLLTTPSSLKSTVLTEKCYQSMFQGCSKITKAPELPAIDLANSSAQCCNDMFGGCSSLNYIKCLAINTGNTGGWVANVSNSGLFVKAPGTNWPRGNNGIPTNWTVIDDGESYVLVDKNSAVPNSTIKVTSNAEWTATTSDSWISLSTTAGTSGETTITVTCTGSPSGTHREGTITIGQNTIVVNQANLPAGYTQVSCISSTYGGHQYINLGLHMCSASPITFHIEGKAKVKSADDRGVLIGCMEEVSPWPGFLIRRTSSTSSLEYVKCNGGDPQRNFGTIGSVLNINISENLTTDRIHDMPATLFCGLNGSGDPWRYVEAEIYSLDIVTYGDTELYLVPCLDSSNVPGLYDVIGETFYSSNGSNPFSYTA